MTGRTEAVDGWTLTASYHRVMGTHLDLQITAVDEATARSAEALVLAEATRLEAVFTVFDPASDLCRWRSGAVAEPGPELADLLVAAAEWQRRSLGTFNPLTAVLTDRWLRAVDEGRPPSDDELADLAEAIAEPRFEARDGCVVRTGDCSALDLNAIAKGHVVDLVADRVMADPDISRLVLNAGGDLVHRGTAMARVAVEDPHQAFDNASPLARVEVANAAVATSGRARRWFDVGGTRWSRVIDPRTGWPVAHSASATVVAPDGATADVVATATSVLEPAAAVHLVDTLAVADRDIACLVVVDDGPAQPSAGWSSYQR